MPTQTATDHWRWFLLFGALGALATGTQTYLLREFIVLLQGDETAVGLGLAAWFAGICAGAALTGRILDDSSIRLAPIAITGLGMSGCAEMWISRLGRALIGAPAGELLRFGPSLLLAVCLFVLPGGFVGTSFVALAKASGKELRSVVSSVGMLYVFESLGSLAGGCVASWLLVGEVSTSRAMLLLLGISLFGCVPATRAQLIAGRTALPSLAIAAVCLATLPWMYRWEQTTERLRFTSLSPNARFVAAKHTRYQHLAIGGDDPKLLYANGQYVASFPDPASYEPLAHQLMVLAHRPERVLGFGAIETGLLRFLLLHPVTHFDLLIPDAEAFRFVEVQLAPEDRAALDDPRVQIIFDEPRRYLSRTRQIYDLVISYESDPTTLLLARTTSVEFDRVVRKRLASDGAYLVRFSAGPNVQSGDVGELGASLFRTLSEVFEVVLATPGPDSFFIAGSSEAHITLDAAELSNRFRSRRIPSTEFFPDVIPELFPPERVATLRRELRGGATSVASAIDDRPIAFLHALAARQRIAGSVWSRVIRASQRHPALLFALVAAPSVLLLCWVRLLRRRTAVVLAAWHATAITGACGLGSSLLVLTSFQTQIGALYAELGVLNGIFMIGLSAGGLVATQNSSAGRLLRSQLVCTSLTLALMVGLVGIDRIGSASFVQWSAHILLLVGVGFGTGLIFPAASRVLVETRELAPKLPSGRVAAGLEFWDHAGAAVSALLSAVVLIPTLGIARSAALLVAWQGLALLLTWSTLRRS